MTPRTQISARRKFLFLLGLALVGALGAAVAGGALIYTDTIRFEWSDGLRRRNRIRREAAKDTRVLVLGDSFLAPWSILGRSLGGDLERYCAERNIGLLNASVGGFGPLEYAHQMEKAAESFRPNLVLLFYYAGNDLTDVLYRPDSAPREPNPPKEYDWAAMERHGIDADLIRRAKETHADWRNIGKGGVSPFFLALAMRQPGYLEDNLLMESSDCEAAWRAVEAKLNGIADTVSAIGAELVLIAIPSTVQLDQSHFNFYSKAKLRVNDRLLEARAPQERLRNLCEKRGIRFLDLLPEFKARGKTEQLYWEHDDHFSEEGHAFAYQAVLREILGPWFAARQGVSGAKSQP